jgi:hypothetical protein
MPLESDIFALATPFAEAHNNCQEVSKGNENLLVLMP